MRLSGTRPGGVPEECEKALAPTIALLGCTGMRMVSDTRRLRGLRYWGLDVGIEAQVFVLFDDHYNLFQGSVCRPVRPDR